MQLLSVAVGFEITGGFLLILSESRTRRSSAAPARSAQRMSFLPFAIAIWIFLVGLSGS